MSNDKSHSVLGLGSLVQGHCIPLGRVWKLPANIRFWFTFAYHRIRPSRLSRCSHCRFLPQRLYRDSLSCLVIEEATAATTGCANGLCENIATKIVGYTNTSGAKRSALPACRISTISSEQCNSPHGVRVRSQLEYIRKLSSGVIPANVESLNITLSIDHSVHGPRSRTGVCVHSPCLSRSRTFDREFPATAASRAPSYFPFEIEPFHAIPHSCIHIPNMLLTP